MAEEQNKKTSDKARGINKALGLALGIILIAGAFVNILLFKKNNSSDHAGKMVKAGNTDKPSKLANAIIKPVSAQEIYSLFICPCCGKTIDIGCCGMAKERKLYADGLMQGRLSKEEVVMAYIKKYGLDSFKDKSKQEEFKQKLIAQAPAIRPAITISPDSYDFGDVSQKEGTATTLFDIKNEGQGDLIINKLETSCGCTMASIVYQGQEGPIFGMPGHGKNEKVEGWQAVIPPGDSAQLKVYYDPDTHKDFRGTAIREIYVFSNDPIDFEKKVKIELNQVD